MSDLKSSNRVQIESYLEEGLKNCVPDTNGM